MLSSVLHSARAIEVNIEIMRAFVRLRQVVAAHAELAHKLDELEKYAEHDKKFLIVFEAILQLMVPPPEMEHRGRIGFQTPPPKVDS